MRQPPPDAPPDVPVTPGRRLGRAAGRFARPFLWALAGLGAAVLLFPRSIGGTVGRPETVRGLSRVTVAAAGRAAWGEANPWHPRFLTVTVLGPELPPDPRWPAEAGPEEIDAAGGLSDLLWDAPANPRTVRFPAAGLIAGVGADREGFYRLDAAMLGGFFGHDPGPMCRVAGASVSAWSLALLAALWGGWRVRRGDRSRSPRATLRRRLARPWVWGLAGLGAVTLIGYVDNLPDRRGGEVTVGLAVNRGPAAAPHPRTLWAGFDWSDPPAWVLDPFCPPPGPPDPPWTVRDVEQDRAFPWAGLWASRMGLRDGDGPFHFGAAATLSLWWPLAAALAWNLLTLARRRRGRRAAAA